MCIYIYYVDGYRRRTSTNCSSQVLLLLLKLLQVGLPQPFLKRFLTVGESGEVSPLSPKRNYSFLSAVNLSAPQIQVAIRPLAFGSTENAWLVECGMVVFKIWV